MPTRQTISPSGKSSTMRISFSRGVECYFDIDGITIKVWGSIWSGREVVELDDTIVSSKYSFRLSTPHEFNHGGHRYKVIFSISKPMSGLVEIELYRDGVLVDSDQGRHASVPIDAETGQVNWPKYLKQIALFAIVGGVIGGIFGYLAATLSKGGL